MKLVVFSDLHLDAAFAWAAAEGAARRRREALRATLRRIVELGREVGAEALLCAGDLYEHERFSPDTMAFLQRTFAELDPVRVFLAPGNHDWYGPESLYRRVAWSPNVHVFDTPRLTPVELRDGLTLWGAAHCAPAGTDGFLSGFRVDRGGVHLGLFHGSERAALFEQGDGKQPHAPFEAEDIEPAGLHHAFVGHYHCPRDAERHTYPGNPEPLAFGESGLRGALVVTIGADGRVQRQRHRVATTEVHDLAVDVSGCASRQEVRDRVAEVAFGRAGIARLTLAGELAQEVDLAPRDLRDAAPWLDAVLVRIGDLRPGYDLESVAHEPTVRGQFVRDVLAAGLEPGEERRVIVTGLRALDGRADLEVL
jgi:DNA repair exonuclease SbcCD nuclease subunit